MAGGSHEDDYRAIGRYVVKFSELIEDMRVAMIQKLSEKDRGARDLADLALSEANPAPIASSFFAMCVHVARIDWESPDGKIVRALSDQVHKAIRKRNDVVHGNWHVAETAPFPAKLWRTDTRRKVPFAYWPTADRAEVQRLTEELIGLRSIVSDVGKVCLYVKFAIPIPTDLLTPTLTLRKAGQGKKAENVVVRKQDEPA
jgi:hypothetical protein